MRYADLDRYNWVEIQEHYNKTNLQSVIDKYGLTTSRLSAAVKQGFLLTRPRSVSRRISGKDRNPHTAKSREKIRQGMLKAVREGRQKTPKPYGKYCKRIPYKNWLGEEMLLLGTWEEKVAIYLDSQKINWTRPKNGIRYIYKNEEHYYFPDFYLTEYGLYLEVKGRELEKDREKWRQFPFKLAIIDKKYIFSLSQFFKKALGW
jgi:hypothetical protein